MSALNMNMTRQEMALIFDNMVSPFSYCRMEYDEAGRPVNYVLLAVNDAFEQETGLFRANLLGRKVLDVFPETEKYWIEAFGEVARTGRPKQLQNYAAALKQWYHVIAYSPKKDHFALTVTNVTELVRQREELVAANAALEEKNAQLDRQNAMLDRTNRLLQEKERFLSETQRVSHIGSYSSDLVTGIWHGTKELNRIFGNESQEEHRISDWFDIVHPDSRAGLDAYYRKVLQEKIRFDYIHRIVRPSDGQERWVHGLGELEYDEEGVPIRMIGTIQDITERKEAEDEIRYLSFHDKLTGLHNRRHCEDRLQSMSGDVGLPLTILMGDVNGLKLVNDAFGHEHGDELLRKAASAMRAECRESDMIARWGGDEFVVLMPQTDEAEVERIVKAIRDRVSTMTVSSLKVQISFGWDTKRSPDEDIFACLKNAENRMYRSKIVENAGMRGNAIQTIVQALHAKVPREEPHSKRVSELSGATGVALGLPDADVERLRAVGLLHDIGKIAVDEELINRAGPLTPSEFEELRRHSDIGYRILSASYEMADLADSVLAHHERWDGGGYPKGLRGTEIPLASRIIAIVDAYDAMTSERPYRNTGDEAHAADELERNAGTQFDPALVRTFLDKVIGG